MTAEDDQFFAMAMRMAERAFGRCWPNPAVGAVIVGDERHRRLLGRGWTQPGGRPHAETVALRAAGDKARGATLYVTLEPCAHHGRMPPCAGAIIEAGVKRVIAGQRDPDERVSGAGLVRLKDAGVSVEAAPDKFRAALFRLNQGHLLRHTRNRPFVQLKLAVGADGLVAPGDGKPNWVTGAPARAFGHLLRARADAILVGRGTVIADDPALTCRLPGMADRSPVRVVADSGLATGPKSKLYSDLPEVPLWLICAEDFDRARATDLGKAGAEILPAGGRSGDGLLDPAAILNVLAARGITRLLVEGGPKIAGSFWKAGLIDEAVIVVGGRAAGGSGLHPLHEWTLEALTGSGDFTMGEQRTFGADRMTVYRRVVSESEICLQV